MEDKKVGTEPVKMEEVQLKVEPLGESVDCLVDYNLGAVEQEIQIGDGPPPCLDYDLNFLPRKPPKPRQRRASGQRNYSCGRCGKSFLRCNDLVKHEKTHTDEKLYGCHVCGKSFRRHTSLLIHERIHTGERPYQCTQCGKSFVQRQHLTTHLRTHTGEKPFQCIECGKGFRWRSELLKHQKNHTDKAGVGFDDLAASFSKEEWMELEEWQKELYRNVMKETSETLISLGEGLVEKAISEKPPDEPAPSLAVDCASNLPLCPEGAVACSNPLGGGDGPLGPPLDIAEGKAFTDGVDKICIKYLDRANGGSSERAHGCAECGKVFYNKRTLRTHLRGHLGERSYICNVCGKCFRRHTSLLIHERIHTGERPYHCTQCGKSFVQRQHLNTHLKTHTGEKPFQCGQCGKGFRWRSELLKHQKVHEEEEGLLAAADPTCKTEKENFLDDDWKAITGEQHDGQPNGETSAPKKGVSPGRGAQERLYPCTQCDKSFLRSSDLARHLRSHLGERPYVCNHCGKCFRRNTSLLIHERIHTGERPYQCAQCGKSFVQRQHLTTHLKTHTGEKPFPCPQCGKSYRWRSELLKHQRVHSNEAAVTFDDVAVCFSEEWKDLEEWQKELYRNMMKESADSLISLGEVWISKNGKETSLEKTPEELEMSSDCKEHVALGGDPACEVRDFPGEEPHSSTDLLRCLRPPLHFLEQRRPPREKLFSCNQCEKRFARSSDLLKHQRSHQGGDKPNLCNECGKIFRRRTALLIHKRIHTGERPYKCKQCGKCFVQRQHLTTHVKTHTGERPYPCSECGKSYRWRSELSKHQKVHADVLSAAVGYTHGCQ